MATLEKPKIKKQGPSISLGLKEQTHVSVIICLALRNVILNIQNYLFIGVEVKKVRNAPTARNKTTRSVL